MSSKISIIFVWITVILLLTMGLVMVASTGVWVETEEEQYSMLMRQALFAGVGLVVALFLAKWDYRIFRPYVWWILLGACFLLALCYVPGVGREINGERRWINLGVQFQPSECAKLCIMMALAHWYTIHKDKAGKVWTGFIKAGVVLGVPLMLIFFEKDMGTASALGVAGLCVMFVAGANIWCLGSTLVAGFAGLCMIVQSNANRMERIIAWRDLEAYRLGAGLQQYCAEIALARGGFDGVGLGNSASKHGTLPFAHTDFIYAPLGEEFGLIGTLGILLCFSFLAFFGMSVAMQTKDHFGRLLAVGIVTIVFCPAMLNIAVVISALPNSGLPLPFISFGGTNLVFTLAAIGILTSIQRHSSVPLPQYSFSRRDERTVKVKL
ncbi:MAG: putative peptidoglycan glycosyltransferase FtsW [Akkermansia sp.]